MRRQSKEGKKRKSDGQGTLKRPCEGSVTADPHVQDDIDPVDFFDPEEFGSRPKLKSPKA